MTRPPTLWTCILLTVGSAAVPLAAGDIEVDGSFVSTVATGTPPLDVTSTSKVDNLNADLLDGLDSTDLFTTANDGAGSGLDADLLDGLDASAFARSLGNVVRVGTTGGDFTSIQAALDSITTASVANPFLVLVGPGVYDERVVMKPFVDIQGAGEGVTKITQSGGTPATLGTVAGADHAELRFVTVENTGGSTHVLGVDNVNASPRLVHVTVEVDGSAGIVFGIRNIASEGAPSAPELLHVTVTADGTDGVLGVQNTLEANTRMHHTRVSVTGSGAGDKWGIYNESADPVLLDVEVFAESTETTAVVTGLVNSLTDGAVLRSVRVEVAGGGSQVGVDNSAGNFTLRDLEVQVSGDGTQSFGVLNDNATVVLESSSILVGDGGNALTLKAGVSNFDASISIRDCGIEVAGSLGAELGVEGTAASGSFTVDVEHSRISAADGAIAAPATYTVQVGASRLDGGVGGGATYACAFAYDGSFTALNLTCT